MTRWILLCLWLAIPSVAMANASNRADMVSIPEGSWRPLYAGEDLVEELVPAFRIDKTPVTNAQFLAFVKAHEQWQRGKIPTLFGGPEYLRHWKSATELGNGQWADKDFPVTHVTWWAARAYCKEQGKRLPTISEWERAAAASETKADASRDAAFVAKILAWYAEPTRLRKVGGGTPNFWGAYDFHQIVWEWVDDFQSEIILVDSRSEGSSETTKFCGAGAVSASRKEDYAAFMRSAMRSSLQANHATSALGFRCAMDEGVSP